VETPQIRGLGGKMKLVIDANIVIAAIIRDSTTRRILFHPLLEMHSPAYLKEELEEHRERLRELADLGKLAFKEVIKTVLGHIMIHDEADYQEHVAAAHRKMRSIDEADSPYLALACAIGADGIWSNDKHFREQNDIVVFSTRDLLKTIQLGP
jgi:predicted nucleic acid-binding protein